MDVHRKEDDVKQNLKMQEDVLLLRPLGNSHEDDVKQHLLMQEDAFLLRPLGNSTEDDAVRKLRI